MADRKIVNKFNRGEVDSKALSRDDFEKVNNSCELMENFIPIRLGAMQYRPGFEYIGEVTGSANYCIPFVAGDNDYALLEFSNNALAIWIDDAELSRTSVTSTITNGTFTSNITGWTDNSGSGSSTAWKTGGYAELTGATTTSAVLYQTLTGVTDTGNEHAMRVVIAQAPVIVQVGTSGVGSTDITEATLAPGTHSLVFTPGSDITITFRNSANYAALVDSVAFEATGAFSLTTSVGTASLPTLRYAQSADVMFCTYDSGTMFRIERRGVKSWSIVDFRADDGPFNAINVSDITLTASALNGDVTLTASDDLFSSSHAGTLFKLVSSGQEVTASVSAEDSGTNSIRVTGVSTGRTFTVTISGTFTATVTLQQSTDGVVWSDTATTYTTATSTTYNDAFDNAILFYRLYVKTGDYTSGTATLTLTYAAGSIEGIARVHTYSSATSVTAQVLQDFGATDATRNWYQGSWSSADGFPSAVALYEGRLWFGGRDKIWGSVSDAFVSFDRDLEGDSASIVKTIGFGPVTTINWLATSVRLLMGVTTSEISVRSSTFGEPLTPTNTNLKSGSTQGSMPIDAIQLDDVIFFAQRSGTKLFAAEYVAGKDTHTALDVTILHQDVCIDGIKKIVVSRQPETRIWVLLDDGELRVYLIEAAEDVEAWSRISTDGTFEDIAVLPGSQEDQVYVVANRTNGRYLEKLAKFSEAVGGTTSKHTDSFVKYTSPGTTITIAHLDTDTVNVWADGQDRGDYTVSSNDITVSDSWTDVVVGLSYNADYTSNKVSSYKTTGGQAQSTLGLRKRIVDLGLVMQDYWPGSIKIGPSFSNLQGMPTTENGVILPTDTTVTDYDYTPFTFNGDANPDPRIFLRATGPCTIMSMSYEVID